MTASDDLTNTIRLSDSDRGRRAAVGLLARGGLVAIPTETVYGLAADARNGAAVAGIFEAKGRPRFNPLILHVPDLDAAGALAHFNADALHLAQAFWPGPLTLVLDQRADNGLSDLVTGGLDTVAIRVPAHPIAQGLLRDFGAPLAAPSANPSGKITATTADHVMAGLAGRIAGVLDAGPCTVGVESTILGLSGQGAPRLLRPGGLPIADVEAALGRPVHTPGLGDDITAPGQLTVHYAPDVTLKLTDSRADGAPGGLWLAFGPLDGRHGISLSPDRDLRAAAANLFSGLHDIDAQARASGIRVVYVDPVPDIGLGAAINDRLRRAAAAG